MSEPAPGVLRFLDFSLDAANAQLRRGNEVIALRPKALAVLEHLAARAGRLVTKTELLDAVWADTVVGEWVLSGCIRELRKALADDPRTPRIIETSHRHGYRFIAAVGDATPPAPPAWNDGPPIVGRADDLAALAARLERAVGGERQLVLIGGEAGIGKTTLVDAFCADLGGSRTGTHPLWIARGQCVQQYGESEPYLPVLEALTRLARSATGSSLRALLRRHAPAWLAQMPSLLEPDESAELQRSLFGTTRERMLREAAELVEVLDRPLVLILEDLHWSDYATLDLLAAVARRRDPASLLVIGTYRPADVIVRDHPMKAVVQDLAACAACHQLWIENLAAPEVERYLASRCPGLEHADALARVLYERTDGNPLFLRSVIDALVARGAFAVDDGRWTSRVDASEIGVDVPDGLAQMIQRQIDHLPPNDRTALEAAAVVGHTPSAAAVAAALAADVVEIEDRLDALARRGSLVRATGEIAWPDGTVAGGYELTHALYQSVLRDGVPPARRRRLHQRVAARLESAFATQRSEIAAELALHLEEAGEAARAVPYLEETATRAVGRGAHREAVAVLERTLGVIDALPPSPQRTLQTIRVSLALGLTLQALKGFAHPEVERALERARALSTETGDLPQLFQAVAALSSLYLSRAELDRARRHAAELEPLVAHMPFPSVLQVTALLNGMAYYHLGPLAEAERYLEGALAFEEVAVGPVPIDFRVQVLNYLSLVRLHAGRPDAAREHLRQAAARAASVGTPFDRSHNAVVACFMSFFLRDLEGLEVAAAHTAALGRDHGFATAKAVGKIAQGRVLAARGAHDAALAAIRDGIAEYRALGQLVSLPSQLAVLAEACADAGRFPEALDALAEARRLAESNGDQRSLAELHRLAGEVRAQCDEPKAEACFRRAIAVARDQGARWWELRARTSLVEWQRAHRQPVNRDDFAEFVAGFTEGETTVDLRAARQAVARMARTR